MTKVSKTQPVKQHGPESDAEPSVLEAWTVERTGKSLDELRTADLLAVPKQAPLRYVPLVSPLGGRLDAHLRHLEEDEAADLLDRGDRFLDETPEASET